MPRPCQKRRASAAANRTPKPAAPPPIRHKARQKAIHNARRGRGRGNGRGNMSGGRPSRNQQSGNDAEQEFISFASQGNNFDMLRSAGTQHEPIALDDIEEGELITDDDSDSDSMADLDMDDAEDMMINVQVHQSFTCKGKAKGPRAEVMFAIPSAVKVYKVLCRKRFPLVTTTRERYDALSVRTSPESASYNSHAPSLTSRSPSLSSVTSDTTSDATPEPDNAARDYMFDWGVHAGKYFVDVPDDYLRTIGGQLDVYEGKHPGLREAYEYYRPGQGRSARPQQTRRQPRPKGQPQPAQQARQQPPAPSKRRVPRVNAETYRFHQGAHKGKKLNEVPENYLRTLEGMNSVMNKWPGLKEALQDYSEKTGRQSRK